MSETKNRILTFADDVVELAKKHDLAPGEFVYAMQMMASIATEKAIEGGGITHV